ncbi:cullin-2 [Schistocerca americana]|uniref:cullin-2 n=1 Tax=Schistocerca americana TaxID=7009 RepID=UPI001F4FFF0F|nr:cullin-2 [Schistocerca americana]XP_046984563.1 cullin-2 [Schistocerca americana]XP_047102574.1 cullin-2 [Schistocerca piceifrons]XP_047102575.1 cullin-2 [Schistocerca piceifrons]
MSLKPKNVDFNETWSALRETVKGVLTLSSVPRSVWNDRFSDVYSLCVAHPEPLADRLYLETKAFLDAHVRSLLEQVRANGENNLLRAYYQAWSQYSLGCLYLHKLYLYLNQQHIRKQKLSEAEIIYGNLSAALQEQMEVGELGLEIWKKNMIQPLKDSLVSLLLEGIHQDRLGEGNPNSTDIIRGVIQSFVSVEEFKMKGNLCLYEEIFETPFLAASGEYYKLEASRLLQTCDVSLYMERVTLQLKEETLRSQKFLHCSSFPKVRAKCEHHMVEEHLPFLHSECKAMVQQERRRDLSLMYPLLRSVQGGVAVLIKEVLEHIKQQGLEAITGLRGDNIHTQFVENMLAVHKKYKELITDVFAGDQSFMGALDKACSYVINYKSNPKIMCRSPELLAKYCDSLLRKSAKGMSDTEIDDRLAQSITIFKYIDDKDVFQKFYSRMLAKRLIHQQSQSMDAEEAMINRLKQACGYEFTNKLHRMFTDISVSSDFTNKFNDFLKSTYGCDLGFNFSMYVLQAGAWPLTQTTITSFSVPKELEKAVQKFETFYHKGFSGRKLTWLHHLSQGELKLGYLKKPYQVTMQTFQMAILLQFQEVDSLTCREVQECLQLFDEPFNKHVMGLIESKLLMTDNQALGPDTVLRLNKEYTNKRTKFRITTIAHKESPQEIEQTISAVDEDRKLYLQAAIVRIMKSRKVLKHNCLIQEVLRQSKASFAPTINLIKKCIEALIDKQYIERTPHSPDEYSYVA